MSKEILLIPNEEDKFEAYEPYATLHIDTEEDYNYLKEAVERQRPLKPKKVLATRDIRIGNGTFRAGTSVYKCSRCYTFVSASYDYCPYCGRKIDWTVLEE